ncbi:hypothetical protein [Methanobacterium subterraneum]|uniref:hypothetical protein n=1 Tax=Methanobacterium subterraneum TaxID=59277 RepID=UPI0013000294|nr:hypothetical protein [Methanobacterium subterraneum]
MTFALGQNPQSYRATQEIEPQQQCHHKTTAKLKQSLFFVLSSTVKANALNSN